jgi:hypothetical protein
MKTSHLAWGVILVVAVPAVLILLWAANVDVIPPSGVPMKRRPVIVLLERAPTKVYVSVGMAE